MENSHDYLTFFGDDGTRYVYSGLGSHTGHFDSHKYSVWQDIFCWPVLPGYQYLKFLFSSDGSYQQRGFYANYTIVNDTKDVMGERPMNCSPQTFRCFTSRNCIDENNKCNYRADCNDRSDELYIHARCIDHGRQQPGIEGCDFPSPGCDFDMFGWITQRSNYDPDYLQDHSQMESAGGSSSKYAKAVTFPNNDQALLCQKHALRLEPGIYCLSFWYWMHGDDVGELHVYKNTRDKLRMWPLWSRRGNFGDTWKHGQLQLHFPLHTNDIKWTFVALQGTDRDAFIALDDISFYDGPCRSPNDDIACNFEETLCGWQLIGTEEAHFVAKPHGENTASFIPRGLALSVPFGPDNGIISPVVRFHTATVGCLVLFYSTSGEQYNGNLELQITRVGVDGVKTIFHTGGGHPGWNLAKLEFPRGDKPFWIKIQASANFSIIDELAYFPGHCYSIQPGSCRPGEMRCKLGKCIDVSKRCDGVPDCPDGEDESHTYSACSSLFTDCDASQFACHNGDCIDRAKRCDGIHDCSRLEDETGCYQRTAIYPDHSLSPGAVAGIVIGIAVILAIVVAKLFLMMFR